MTPTEEKLFDETFKELSTISKIRMRLYFKSFLISTLDERMKWVRGAFADKIKSRREDIEFNSDDEEQEQERLVVLKIAEDLIDDVLNSITKGSKED